MLSIILPGNASFNSIPRKVSFIIAFSFNFNSKHSAIKIWCWGCWQFWHRHKYLCRMICSQLKHPNNLQEHNFELKSNILLFSLGCSFLAIKLTTSAIFFNGPSFQPLSHTKAIVPYGINTDSLSGYLIICHNSRIYNGRLCLDSIKWQVSSKYFSKDFKQKFQDNYFIEHLQLSGSNQATNSHVVTFFTHSKPSRYCINHKFTPMFQFLLSAKDSHLPYLSDFMS